MNKMSRIFISSVVFFMLLFSNFIELKAQTAEGSELETITVLKFYVDPSDIDDEIIRLYESNDWEYHGEYFKKEVKHENDKIKIDGKKAETNDAGNYDVQSNKKLKVLTEAAEVTGQNPVSVNVKAGETKTIKTEIDVNTMLDNMSMVQEEPQTNKNGVTSIGQKNGEKPKKGDAVSCNRFNGYGGNGRYYADRKSKQAIKNFANSDCDQALAFYTLACLRDYLPSTKLRYCGLMNKTTQGHCSTDVGHSKKYHKHTNKWK